MDTLIAHTQYTDMRGTAAVDESDHQRIAAYLLEQNKITEEEYVAAISFFFHSANFVHVRIFVTNLDDRKLIGEASRTGIKIHPESFRKVSLEVTLPEFFSFFKRFSIKLVDRGFEGALDEIDIDNVEE